MRFDSSFRQVESSQGDEWAPTWGRDDILYTGNDDGASFGGMAMNAIAFGKLEGDDPLALRGSTVNPMEDFREPGGGMGPDGANWKVTNCTSVDGVLYMFVTRCLYPENSGDTRNRHVFRDSSIIKSTDGGRTWTRPAADNLRSPMFPGKRFGAPYFVWHGKDGEASVDNAAAYVYAVSNNGHFESGDNYILGRVRKATFPALSPADWTFFRGGDGLRDEGWTGNPDEAQPILADENNCSMTGMTHIPALGRYVMVVWHYTTYNLRKDPTTVVEFVEAPRPWGPWTPFKKLNTGHWGWYVPVIGQRFQVPVGRTSVSCTLFVSGNYTDASLYKLNFIPITLSTEPLPHGDPAYVGTP